MKKLFSGSHQEIGIDQTENRYGSDGWRGPDYHRGSHWAPVRDSRPSRPHLSCRGPHPGIILAVMITNSSIEPQIGGNNCVVTVGKLIF